MLSIGQVNCPFLIDYDKIVIDYNQKEVYIMNEMII